MGDLVAIPEVGTLLPHFTVTTTGGGWVNTADVWQREQLLVVILPQTPAGPWVAFEEQLEATRRRCQELETRLVMSRDRIPGFDRPWACVADRWGEVTHVAVLQRDGECVKPDVPTLLLWVEATLHRCPECEGEAR